MLKDSVRKNAGFDWRRVYRYVGPQQRDDGQQTNIDSGGNPNMDFAIQHWAGIVGLAARAFSPESRTAIDGRIADIVAAV